MEWLDLTSGLLALILLEIVLGIDNLVFLTILTERLPEQERSKARRWGLTFAWMTRLLLLAFAVEIVSLTKPLVTIANISFSWRDIFLLAGGAFLIAKATQEIHNEIASDDVSPRLQQTRVAAFHGIVVQVALMDVVFSFDSVLTAVGLTTRYWVMVVAISLAILVMLYASEPVSQFIKKFPTIKMLAISFLILIGMVLVADGFAFHVPRGYVYFAMGFSLAVEALNLIRIYAKRRSRS